jgi:hypothetical protein
VGLMRKAFAVCQFLATVFFFLFLSIRTVSYSAFRNNENIICVEK